MKSLLFVVNEAGEFVELSRVAQVAKSEGYLVSFLFAQPGYINLRRNRAFCRLNGFDDYYLGKKLRLSAHLEKIREKENQLENGYMPNSLLMEQKSRHSLIVRWLAMSLALVFLRLVSTTSTKKKRRGHSFRSYLYAKKLFKHLRPDLVIFGQEFPGSINTLLIKLCNRDGVPTLIIPFAVGTTKEMVESLSDKPDYEVGSSLMNRLAASLYPQWVNYYAGKSLLRLPGRNILILEGLGLAPEHPWLPNNSAVTCIAVESVEMEKYYRHMRFPDSQLRLTGAPYDDCITTAIQRLPQIKQKLRKELNLPDAKPILLCAWPPDQFGSRFIPLEFGSYKELCGAWAKALALIDRHTEYKVIICPHPVTDPTFLVNILQPYRLHKRVTGIDTLELVPISDLFVACVSSTLRWAISCGIPAINYDCYDYGYTNFDSGLGVSTIKRYSEFNRVLQQLTEEPAAYEAARNAQAACAADWGMQDGKSMQRILNLVCELTGTNKRTPYEPPSIQ